MILFGIAAVVLGAIAIVSAAVNRFDGRNVRASPTARNFALCVAIACLILGGYMLSNARSRFPLIVPVLCGIQIVTAVTAIIAWCSRWRPLTEGAATISLGIFSILTGFSIGIFFLPVALAMGVAAVSNAASRDTPGAV